MADAPGDTGEWPRLRGLQAEGLWLGQALGFLRLAPRLSWDAGEEGVWGPISKENPPFPDMTFIHEGNHTLVENLINFEKMVSSGKCAPSSSLGWQCGSCPGGPGAGVH